MTVDARKKMILKAVIDRYIGSAEPVGSKTLSGHPGLDISPATLRNEMSALEAMGLLEQPHTSAGRIPTPNGYRVYVDELMQEHNLSRDEQNTIDQVSKLKMAELDSLLNRASRLIADLTRYATVTAAGPAVQEERVYVAGEANLLDYPEFHDLMRARRTLEYITEQRAALIRSAPVWEREGVRVVIGPENAASELSDASVLMATYPVGGGARGMIGIVGPTRMDYSRMVSRLRYFAEKLSEITREE
ncbi:MAG: heat-inducible transcriptional repressor HrcA [Oscillospiraceae bacterium]|jgi:transcriptional regulator of heat shock response|nr:heat-inducible transcriptional repressor HrcA [Oscillospiraceae bacterium]